MIGDHIKQLVEKVRTDEAFAEKFKSSPIDAIEAVLGTFIPEDEIEIIIDGVIAEYPAVKPEERPE